ncbi:MAG TPA: PEP-CTERM sorting domain-containing protein [Armatimonadota bacterium]|jgi:hypothetical protein
MRLPIALIAAGAILAAPAAAALDGKDLPSKFGGAALATQTNGTGFGDNYSEADQLFGESAVAGVHIGVTGNIEQNGNPLILFLDTMAGGSNVLNAAGGTYKVTNANGLTFDDDFAPDFAVEVDAFGGQLYGNYINLQTGENAYVGQSKIQPTGSGDYGFLNPAISFAYDNSNTAGVTASDATGAATATTGIEFLLDPTFFGLAPGASFKLLALFNGQGGDYLSNQFLPGLPAGTGNLGNPKNVDLRQYAGNQFVTVPGGGGAVPEPASLSLLAFGLLPLIRRKK